MARIAVTGATGTIGIAVVDALRARGDEVVALSRDADRGRTVLADGVQVHGWSEPTRTPPPPVALAGADAVVHLLGEPVAQRWTEDAKQAIRDSRELATRMLVAGLQALGDAERPGTLVSQSATGFYGPRGEQPVDEQTHPGSDFLADVVVAWEREAQRAAPPMRVVLTRTGVVLSPSGGALGKMLPFFRLGLGGPVAGGQQYIPWVHLDDVVGALLFCVDNREANGPVNLTAPFLVTNAELSHALGRALGRPAILPVPALALRLLYGEMSQMVTTGQRAVPKQLEELGYRFRYQNIDAALADVLGGA
jgi:uncharacterized protein (TIGR01777 family)